MRARSRHAGAFRIVLALALLVPGTLAAQGSREASRTCAALVDSMRLPPAAATLVHESLTRHGGTVVRWRNETRVIEVWVQNPGALRTAGRVDAVPNEGEAETWRRAVSEAMESWRGALPNLVLRSTRDLSASDVQVTWVHTIDPMPNGVSAPSGRSGVIRHATSGAIEGAQIWLAMLDRLGKPFNPDDVRATAIHEFGHVLGLAHQRPSAQGSGEGTSVMSANITGDVVTETERRALRAWYRVPVGAACRLAGVAHTPSGADR